MNHRDYIFMTKINNELINPLSEFSIMQLNIYKENLSKLKDIDDKYNEYKDLLDEEKSSHEGLINPSANWYENI